jgi:phospholipase D1/2
MPIDPAAPEAAPRTSRRAHLLKFLVLGAIVAGGFAAIRFTPLREHLTGPAIEALLADLRGNPWAPLAFLGAYVGLLPFGVPASPLMLAGGIVFGAWKGFLLNFLGVMAGGSVTFFLGRSLGRGFIEQIGGRRLERLEKRLARASFWSLVGFRFLPLPFTLLNYAAALVGIRPTTFLASTAIGTAPPVLLYTWFASELSRAVGEERRAVLARLGLALLALAALIFVPRLVVGLKRRRRLADLRRLRRVRNSPRV